jgi:CRISPR/Cas system-associated endonuclease Cas1
MQYVRLFGKASYELCKEVVQDLIDEMPQDQIPSVFEKDLKFSEEKKMPEILYEKTLKATVKLEQTQENLKREKLINREADKVIKEIERELKR